MKFIYKCTVGRACVAIPFTSKYNYESVYDLSNLAQQIEVNVITNKKGQPEKQADLIIF
ncbi:hypothetical protein JCM9140_325 [Halalkalibacter wakoensis JCM 9140]|uniref:Uncharacterized protein n=1 Tax=Halalkalibacter wakoensis JCM 9140 TaxID=1236970 RepID=W4PXK5_9BACI|nr:hypothetical protein [Halalkalibacter wakoensis]GAE24405.1 hypothetical protein JCM9140_325 [Halalkalibacter wakoensis JCM 9140]